MGTVVLNPAGGTYEDGAQVTITANPADGWVLSGWTGAVTGATNPAAVTMNSHKIVTAVFDREQLAQYSMAVNTDGSGSVTLAPAGGTYEGGTQVTLTANPAAGWEFSGWTGAVTGGNNSMALAMDGHKIVTAVFKPKPVTQYNLAVNTAGS